MDEPERSESEFRNLLMIELSEFRKLSHQCADSNIPNALNGIQDFDFTGIGLVVLIGCLDLSFYRFQLFFQASNNSLDRHTDIGIDSLLDMVVLLFDKIQELINGFENQGYDDLQAGVPSGRPSRGNFFIATETDAEKPQLSFKNEILGDHD
ncbi:MAG: hypothetical protein FJ267_09115 [Planctomycetes bacterium]|nr:hypothetical protein [Planctomycetota bacterium]